MPICRKVLVIYIDFPCKVSFIERNAAKLISYTQNSIATEWNIGKNNAHRDVLYCVSNMLTSHISS